MSRCTDATHAEQRKSTSTWRRTTAPLAPSPWRWRTENGRLYEARNCIQCGSTLAARIDRLGRVVRSPARDSVKAGDRFGRWVILERPDSKTVAARCDCGRERRVYLEHVRRGVSLSCGCVAAEKASERNRTHGLSKTPEFRIWQGIKARCKYLNYEYSQRYALRGITVCDRWRESFENFLADVGLRPSEMHSIDRIDNDKGYEPGNCRWATKAEQHANRCCTRRIEAFGKNLRLDEWESETGISRKEIYRRFFGRGWSAEKTLTQIPRTARSRKNAVTL